MTLTDSDVWSIKAALNCWEWVGYISTAIVFLGCVGEFVAEFTSIPKSKEAVGKLARLSLIVLILGIAGELLGAVRTSQLSGQLIADTEERAGKAEQKAGEANDRASANEKEAQQLKSENLKLEALIQPRDISSAADVAITKIVEPFRGRLILLLEYQDPEAIRLATLISHALTGGAEYPHGQGPVVQTSPLQEGITVPLRTGVEITGDDQELVKTLKKALFSEAHLESAPKLTQPRAFVGGFMFKPKVSKTPEATIYVGLKPLRFLPNDGSPP